MDQLQVAEGGGHQQIRPTTLPHQEPRHFLAVADHPLRRRGFVVHIAGIDFRAVAQEKFGDFDAVREMQRRLAVSAAGMHERRVGQDQFAEPVHHTEPGGGMDVHDGPAFDGVGSQFRRCVVEQPETAGPPATLWR